MESDLRACPECDTLVRRRPLAPGEVAACPRCGARLYARARLSPDAILALVTTALVTLVIANAFPIVHLEVQGLSNSATLFGSIAALLGEGRDLIAALVFATTFLFPSLDLVAMALLLGAVVSRRRPAWFAPLLRFVLALRPWGMIEVFMLGVVVALVKLSHLAHILPGAALWAFAALTVLLAAILTYDPRNLWDEGIR